MTDKTALGDRMKAYETPSTSRRAYKGQPLVVRLDGNNFHGWTKGLKRPYDERLSNLMVDVTAGLVETFQPRIGYTQSDEITLVWYWAPHETPEYPYDGRLQKIESLMAAYCSAHFNRAVPNFLPEKAATKFAFFDARAFVVPTLAEAANCVLWRQQDATKNAISMAAQSMFSHKSLQGLHGPEMQEKMWTEKGINFNDYPFFFKRGTFVRRVSRTRSMCEDDYRRIPEEHWPIGGVITRSVVEPVDIWLTKEEEREQVLFFGAEPMGTIAYQMLAGSSILQG